MKKTLLLCVIVAIAGCVSLKGHQTGATVKPISGPLRVHSQNPRYFTDVSGKAIYLTGAHTWNTLVDMGRNDPPEAFDFNAYLRVTQPSGIGSHQGGSVKPLATSLSQLF